MKARPRASLKTETQRKPDGPTKNNTQQHRHTVKRDASQIKWKSSRNTNAHPQLESKKGTDPEV
jgi:hypothetical protein